MTKSSDPGGLEGDYQSVKLAEYVYSKILERILSGVYAQNSKLPAEIELAQLHSVSRPVVREALSKLRDDGIIRSRKGSGSYVMRRPGDAMLRFAPIASIADIQRCFEFRAPVESAAAALAAERHNEESIQAIRAALESLATALKTGDVGDDVDYAFHQAIANATRNRFYVAMISSIRDHVRFGMRLNRSLSLLQPQKRLKIVQSEHIAIYNAIEIRDVSGARIAMLRHIQNARHRVFEGYEDDDT